MHWHIDYRQPRIPPSCTVPGEALRDRSSWSARPAKSQISQRRAIIDKPKRSYYLPGKLVDAFDKDCAKGGYVKEKVVAASMLAFLESNPGERAKMFDARLRIGFQPQIHSGAAQIKTDRIRCPNQTFL